MTSCFAGKVRLRQICLSAKAEKALGIKTAGRSLHGTRRSFADRLFENYQMDVPDVQNIMRHRDISTTLNHYKSVKQRKLIQKMNEKNERCPSVSAPLKCSFEGLERVKTGKNKPK